jgi:hypothetical protein
MPRPMSSAMLAAIQSTDLQPALFVELTFNGATAYLWSGNTSITWNSQTWSGLGSLLSLAVAEDGATVEARGITITVSGLDPNLLPDCLNDFQLGLPAIAYLGFFSGGSLISTPITSWSGRMDLPTIDVSGETATIAINCESRLLDMNIPCDRRYTQQDQQMTWPDDLGFQFVDSIQEFVLAWGQSYNATNNV